MRIRHLLLLLAVAPLAANAASLYLCKAYSGGTFWSSGHCGTQKATIERIVSVPDNMPFEQQVQLGNQAVAEAARLNAPPPPQSSNTVVQRSTTDECGWLEEHIRHLDAMARQPQSAAGQDRLAQQRKEARDRQFRLRCR